MPRPTNYHVRLWFSAEICRTNTCLPRHETDGFDDCGLNDLLAWEHTPRHSIRSLRVVVRSQVALLVDRVVGDEGVACDDWEELGQQFG